MYEGVPSLDRIAIRTGVLFKRKQAANPLTGVASSRTRVTTSGTGVSYTRTQISTKNTIPIHMIAIAAKRNDFLLNKPLKLAI